jgi:hypothetical protein
MTDSRRPATPLRTPDLALNQRQSGEVSGSAQERMMRSGENRHSEVISSTARLSSRADSAPNTTGLSRWRSDTEQRPVRRRPSTVLTPGFMDIVSRLQVDSAEAIRTRTAKRVHELHQSEPSEVGEENTLERDDYVEFDRAVERMSNTTSHQPTQINVRDQDESFIPDEVFFLQRDDCDVGPVGHEESPEDIRYYQGFNFSQSKTLKPKYYAVKRGRQPGVYRTWEQCERQVDGFSRCEFKAFTSEHEAQHYLHDNLYRNEVHEVVVREDNAGRHESFVRGSNQKTAVKSRSR